MSQRGLLLRAAEVEGRLLDVRVRGDRVVEVGVELRRDGENVVEVGGSALLPGLHDHHIHLHALAAADLSVAAGPPHVRNVEELVDALRRANPVAGWVRAVDYHESVAGDLDRRRLDSWVPHVPMRVQHRSGALWVLNSAALERVASALPPNTPGVERDPDGTPTGRLWRLDDQLISALPDRMDEQRAALREVTRRLLAFGLTGVTDATPDLTVAGVDLLEETRPLRLHLLGAPEGTRLRRRWTHGPRKLLLHDHALPTFDELVAQVDPSGLTARRRPVAVHCVTRESLVLTLAVLTAVGPRPGDRIEHGSVVPPELDDTLRELGVTIVSQPDFLRTRGTDYLRDVDPDDRPHLYRWASLVRAGVPVAPSSDAPFGDADPWQVLRSARDRRTDAGVLIGARDRVPVEEALAGFLAASDTPGGPSRRVEPGAPADLCILHVPLGEALIHPHPDLVRATIAAGRLIEPT